VNPTQEVKIKAAYLVSVVTKYGSRLDTRAPTFTYVLDRSVAQCRSSGDHGLASWRARWLWYIVDISYV